MINIILLVIAGLVTIGAQAAETEVSFLNDREWEGPSAAFLMALDEGYYSKRGLNVRMEPGKGRIDGIARVEAGDYDFASVDINTLIRYKDKNPESQLKAVYVIYNSSTFAVVGKRSSDIAGPKNLEGNKLAIDPTNESYALWSAFLNINRIDSSLIKLGEIGAGWETLLLDIDADAIAGSSIALVPNLLSDGIPNEELSLMLINDFGFELYGNVLIVNPDLAANNPSAVRGFVEATTQGFVDTIANPSKAIKHVFAHNEFSVESTELRRLTMAIGYHIVTDEVRQFGIGGLQLGRLERSIEQLSMSYPFTNRPSVEDIFDESFLPSKTMREAITTE